ncbi:MAG: hypothetical protein A3K68_03250 [Euryarchaeota archaeon RBG_16_68_13]|nr:MAG: hypothetical protein A3K68_03250 [Euryarchaeota archaeon RBG_16_68_13]
MAQGVEWVGSSAGPEEGPKGSEEVEREVRELRAQVRRLQEQVSALASRPRDQAGRVPTHVRGLDGTIEGGIPRGHVVVIAGPTGSMKTSLGLHILAKNRAAGLRGVYVTIEEGRDSLLETMRRFGLGETEDFLVDIGRLRLEHAGTEEVRNWMQVLQDYLSRRRERDPVGIVVIDSINALIALTQMNDVRAELFRFFNFLRSLGVATIGILELDPMRPGLEADVEFLSDGLFELRFSGAGEGKVKLLVRCAKMRHTNHSRDYFELSHDGKGFVAHPYEEPRRRWGRR